MHVPGHSWLHRTRPGVKLAVLALLGGAAAWVSDARILAAAGLVVLAGYASAGVPLRRAWEQARALMLLLALAAAAQAWFEGPWTAAALLARILTLVWAAGLVTCTTPFTDMMEALERLLAPLARLGLRPRRLSFALTLAVRFIPTLYDMIRETREAQAARGLGRNPLALAVPLVIRAIRLADRVAEAVTARGLDDDPLPEREPTSCK